MSAPQLAALNTAPQHLPSPLAHLPSPTSPDNTPPMPVPHQGTGAYALPSSAVDSTKLIPVAAVLAAYPKLQCESKWVH